MSARRGCGHGSGVLPVRGSDRWAAAGDGGHGGGGHGGRCGGRRVSDAAGKAVPAGVAGQALPEPYVPGSGDRVPAELRLVLAGYVGIACGLFAGALACAAATVSFVFADAVGDRTTIGDVSVVPLGLSTVCFWVGLCWALVALQARIRFSRLLRRPSDPRTATVMASKRGGRTLILDIPWDGTGAGTSPCPRFASRCGRRPACWCPVRG